MQVNARWSSHLPILYRVLPLVEGPVLELGVGFYSTAYLHWFCEDKGLKLESYEKEDKYYRLFRRFRNNNHKVIYVDDWDKVDFNKHYGLVFIDHGADRRAIEAIRLADKADYVIIHDTEEESDFYYNLKQVWPHFKYRKDFKFLPRTTVLSNFKELDNI